MDRTLPSLLREIGLRSDQAALWAGFISQCFQYVGHAEGKLKQEWDQMIQKIINRDKVRTLGTPEETDITKELYCYCDEFRKGRPMKDPMKYIVARCEDPHFSKVKTGKESEFTDLGFEHIVHDLKLQIEAKRLMNDGVAEYLGDAGMGVFTTRKEPRTREPVGAMFGYVLANSPQDWITKINEKRGKALPGDLKINNDLETTLYSVEDRSKVGLGEMLLLHRFTNYTAVFAAPAKKQRRPRKPKTI